MTSSFSLLHWKDVKIEEFYHPSYQNYLKVFMDFTFACSCLLYTFTTFVILTKSTPKMGTFKTTILMQLTFNIFYEIILFLFAPIVHFPLLFISYDGYFNVDKIWGIHILAFLFFLVIGGIAAFITSLIQRVESLFPGNRYESIHHKITFFGHFISTIFVSITFLVPLYMIFEESDENMKSQVPALHYLYYFLPSTIGVDVNKNPTALMAFIIISGFWVAFFVISFTGLNLIFNLKLRKLKNLMTKETYALQKMLHRTLIIQMTVAIFFMVIPMLIISGSCLSQNIIGSWIVNLALPISSIHMIFDCPCILIFIKPYRTFLWKLFCRKQQPSNVVILSVSKQTSFG